MKLTYPEDLNGGFVSINNKWFLQMPRDTVEVVPLYTSQSLKLNIHGVTETNSVTKYSSF